jgi:ketosteroid isomerase-like protein
MPSAVVERFMSGLKRAEESHDPGPVAALFGDDAELTNLAREEPRRGADGARQFWADYLHGFARVRSEFFKVFEGDGTAALEWTAEGELPTGKPIRYRGISVLELDGDRVRRFRTYYDSAAFVAPAAEPAVTSGAPKPAARPAPDTTAAAVDPSQEADPDTAG